MNARAVKSSMDFRFEAIRPYIVDRDVLDVGAGSGHWREDWVHARLRGEARHVLGVDHAPEYVAEAQKRGADMVLGDVETLDLEDQFDVVVAGEIIEHVSNVGTFLDACSKHLRPDGRLILTTPYAFSLSNLIRRGLMHQPPNPDHTAWYCDRTIVQSVERNSFVVESVDYLRHETPGRARSAVLRPVNALIGPRLAASTLFVVARKSSVQDS